MIAVGRGPDHGDAGTFEVADLRDWTAPDGVDVLVSNATLQWLPDHLDLLPRARARRSGRAAGWPSRCPATSASPATRSAPTWPPSRRTRAHTRDVAVPASHDPATYLEALAALGCAVDAWETTYLHVLTGEDPVFTWVSGTGARPTLQALPDGLRQEFEAEFRARLRDRLPRPRPRRRAAVPPDLRGGPGRGGRPMRLHHVQVAMPAGRRGRRPALLPRRARDDRGREARRPPGPRRRLVPGVRRRRRGPRRDPRRRRGPVRARPQGAPGPRPRLGRRSSTPWPRASARLGFEVDDSQRTTFPGHLRLHTFDGHGNRVEVLAPAG